LIPTCFRPI